LEKLIMQRQPTVESVYSHIELASPEILPSARVSRPLQQRVKNSVEEAAAGFEALSNVHNIQVRQVEGRLFVTLEANVDGDLSITEAHELSTQLQEAIRAVVPNAGEVLVHLEPAQPPVQSMSV
jgi:ferrous-iron efflux pump FieF